MLNVTVLIEKLHADFAGAQIDFHCCRGNEKFIKQSSALNQNFNLE